MASFSFLTCGRRAALIVLGLAACLSAGSVAAQSIPATCVEGSTAITPTTGNDAIDIVADCTINAAVDFMDNTTSADSEKDHLTIKADKTLTVSGSGALTKLENLTLERKAQMTGLATLKLGDETIGSGNDAAQTKGSLVLGSEAIISGLTTLTANGVTLHSKAEIRNLGTLNLKGTNASLIMYGDTAITVPASGNTYTAVTTDDDASITNQGSLDMVFTGGTGKVATVNNYYDLRIQQGSNFSWNGNDEEGSSLIGRRGRIYIAATGSQGGTDVQGIKKVTIEDGHLVVAGTLNLGNGTLEIQDYGKLIFEIGGVSGNTVTAGKVVASTVKLPASAAANGAKIGLRLGKGISVSDTDLDNKSADIIVAKLEGAQPVLDSGMTLAGASLNVPAANATATVTVSLAFSDAAVAGTGTDLGAPPGATPRPSPYAGQSSSGGGGGTALGVVGLGTLLWLLRQSTVTESEYQAGGLTGIPGLGVAGETHRLGASGGIWTAHQNMGRDRTQQAWGLRLLERGSWNIGFLAGESRVRADRDSALFAHANGLTRSNEFAFYGHWKEGAWGGSVLLAHSRQRAQTALADATGAYAARTTGHGYMAQASIGREFEVRGWRLRPRASLIGVRFEESGFSAANEAFAVRRNAAHWNGALVGTGLDARYDLAASPATGRFLRLQAHAAVVGQIAGSGSTQHFVHEDRAGALSYKSQAQTLAEAEQTQYAVGVGVQSGQARGWHFGSGYMAATDAEGGLEHGVMLGVHRAF